MFKRDISICIKESGTSNNPIVLPIVDDTIDISTKEVSTSVTNKNLARPRFTELDVNRGKRESTLKFTTYIKPYTNTNVELADSLLYQSLLGYNIIDSTLAASSFGVSIFGNALTGAAIPSNLNTISTDEIYMESINTAKQKKFDVYLIYKDSGITFSLKDAVTLSAEFIFDIKGISRVKWNIVGVDYKQDTKPIYNLSDNIDVYLPSKWTAAHLDFPPLNTEYDLASTNFSLSIKNSIDFTYNEKIGDHFATPDNNPILNKRVISAKFSMYLKVVSLSMYNDFLTTLEQYSYLDNAAIFTAKIGQCGSEILDITLNNISLKYPKIKLDEMASLDLVMKSDKVIFKYK